MTKNSEYRYIGARIPIRDAALKVTGQMEYVGDIRERGMLYAKVLFSPVAHARIRRIDTSKAEALPGVRAVATHLNSSERRFNSAMRFYEHNIPETERIFDDTVRFVGDRVAAVAADSLEIAQKAVRLIEVEYEPLPIITDVEKALEPGAFSIHGNSNAVTTMVQNAGDVEKGFAESDHVFEDRYVLSAIHHCAIEPHVAIASYDARGKLTVTAPNQNTFATRILLGRIFGLPFNKIRVHSPAIGGAFGEKLEATIEPVAAQLAIMTGKPVKLELTRAECITSTRTRHGAVITIKSGVRSDGTLLAQEFRVLTNTGAYAGSALNVMGAMSHKVFKVYKVPNMRFTGIPVYTNTPVAGAMRGYGSPQAFFAQQRQMDRIARELKIDPFELQRKNLVEPDGIDWRGPYPIGNPRPLDCLKRTQEFMRNWPELSDEGGKYMIGTGMAIGSHGNGCFGAHRDQTCLALKMNEDGSCILFTGTHDMGNASVTVQTQVVAEILDIDIDRIECVVADSEACPYNLGDYASRGTFVSAGAAKKVAESVRAEIVKEAALFMKEDEADLILSKGGVVSSRTGKRAELDDIMVHAQNVSHREIFCQETYAMPCGPASYGVHAARVRVERATGDVEVTDYVAVHDVGTVINRMGIEGQLEGAIQMGIGYALLEGLEFDENGKNKYNNFRTYRTPRATQMPRIQVDFIEEGEPYGPFGAKSIGECAVVPSAPALINAVSDALKTEIREIPYRHLKA